MDDPARFHVTNEFPSPIHGTDWGEAANPSGWPSTGSGAERAEPSPGPQPVPLEVEHGPSCQCFKCYKANGRPLPSSSVHPLETSVKNSEDHASPLILPPPKEAHVLDDYTLASNFRHSGWREIRRKVFEGLKRTGQTASRLSAFAACGSNMTVMQSKEQFKDVSGRWGHKYRIKCNCCHDRLCTPCANARSLRIRDALMHQLEGKSTTFITLTLAGKDQGLTEKVDRLYKHFRALRLHPTWADSVKGGAAFLEIKYNDKARRWHPHLHIICHAGFIPQGELSDAWRSITKDSFIVDIKAVREEKTTASYVCKYASKPLNTSYLGDIGLLDEAIMALKGRRLCLTFGDWYGTPLTAAEDEELADDMIDAGGYDTHWPINTLFQLGQEGDPLAMHIIRSLNVYDKFVGLTGRPAG